MNNIYIKSIIFSEIYVSYFKIELKSKLYQYLNNCRTTVYVIDIEYPQLIETNNIINKRLYVFFSESLIDYGNILFYNLYIIEYFILIGEL